VTVLGPTEWGSGVNLLRPRREAPAAAQACCRAPFRSRTYISRAIEAECLALAHTPKGARNDALNRAGYPVARFIATGEADLIGGWGRLPLRRWAPGVTSRRLSAQ
jgi:hypothetical protein